MLARASDRRIFSNCKPNWVNCAGLQLGGVSWLPAFLHLTVNASVSVSYVDNGLCSDTSSMYNPLHCEVCRVRNLKVEFGKLLFVIALARGIIEVRKQDTFIDSVTHELKSPLASLQLCLETLGREGVEGEDRETAEEDT